MTSPPTADIRVHAATFTVLRALLDKYDPVHKKKRSFGSHDWFGIDRALKVNAMPEADDIRTLQKFVTAYAPGSEMRKPYCQIVKKDWPQIQAALNALNDPTGATTEQTAEQAALALQFLHCVRCHKEFLEDCPSGCTIPHVWDSESAEFQGRCSKWGDKIYEYKLACCPTKGLIIKEEGAGNGTYNAPGNMGSCFRGNHTVDPRVVRYNGENICECSSGRAGDGVCHLEWDRGTVLFGGSCLYAP